MSKPFVILPRELGQVPPPMGLVGQKARGLSQLLTLKARVPRFGVVTAAACDEFLQFPELRLALIEARAGLRVDEEASLIAIGERLVREAMATPLPDTVLDGIAELKRAFADDDVFAIRASVVGEDLEVRALSGQLDAALGTRDVEGCVQRLFALVHHPRTLRARLAAGLEPLGARLAVVVQRLVPAEQSGVCLSFDIDESDAAARRPRAVVRACFGLAGGIGGRDGNDRIARDELVVARPAVADDGLPDDARVQTTTVKKPDALRAGEDGRGTRMVALAPEQITAATLSPVQARLVVKEALRLEAALGRPQVMGFAFAGRLLHILDVEPLLVPSRRVESTRVRVWDERLVPAPLQQPTSTLSFSVWQRGVARGMERAGRVFGVRGVVLEELRPQFCRALGTVTGRLTGNVDVIGALVDLLPFAEKARTALARVTGQPELSARTDGSVFAAQHGRQGPSLWERARQKIDETRWPGQVERYAAVAEGEGQAFIETVDVALADIARFDVGAADPDALMDTFDALEEHLGRAIAGLALHGVVASLALVMLDDELAALDLGHLRSDLLVVDEDPAKPRDDALSMVRRLHALVALIDRDPELASVCRDGDVDALATALREDPSFAALRQGLAAFIDAWPAEGALLLEEQRLAERPHRLLQLLIRLWRSPRVDLAARHRDAIGRRKKAEYLLEQAIAALPGLKSTSARKRVGFAVQTARHHADRFARAWVPLERVIAGLRRVALGLGERLFEHGLLEQPRDVFFLQDAELAGVIRGSGPDVDVRPLVLARRRAAATRPPAMSRRTETRGVVATSLLADDDVEVVTSPGRSPTLEGVGVAAGEGSGAVCLVDRVVDDEQGCAGVLVVGAGSLLELPLLATAGAVIIERGAMLSPVSAGLRQLAVPTVVQTPAATAAFSEGELVTVNAVTGVVARSHAPAVSTASSSTATTTVAPAAAPMPVGAFLREAIATDPTGRPTRRATRPGGIGSELPAPPAAGAFVVPPPSSGRSSGTSSPSGAPAGVSSSPADVGGFSMPPAIQLSDEGAPVDDADVVDEEPVR
jgi:pyruvate,water dikinase